MRTTGQLSTTVEAASRATYATFGAGLFTNGQWDMLGVVVPLYAAFIGLSAVDIGLIVGARSILPTVLSIHGGILMDRLGTRRVTIWLAVVMATLPLLYPVSGWFVALFILQMAVGFAVNLAMAGTQTLINQLSGGRTADLANFSFSSRVGSFIGPILVGGAWDAFGPWVAFSCVALWGACTVGAVLLVPASQATLTPDAKRTSSSRGSAARDLIPRWADHTKAVALATVPAVSFVLALTFLRNGPGAIQASFYVVYLREIGLTGSVIGAMVGLSEIFGGVGALIAAPLARFVRPHWSVIVFVASAIFFIVITPLIGRFIMLLAVAAALRGLSQGVSQPIMFSMLSQAVGPEAQGAAVGLRNTVNRLSSMILPVAMGGAASLWGMDTSFYLTGALLLVLCAGLMIAVRWK